MNKSLSVEPEELEKLGTATIGDATEFNNLIKKLEAEKEDIKNSWMGPDSTSYINAIEEDIKIMKELGKQIEEIGKFFKDAARVYSETTNAIKDGIKTS